MFNAYSAVISFFLTIRTIQCTHDKSFVLRQEMAMDPFAGDYTVSLIYRPSTGATINMFGSAGISTAIVPPPLSLCCYAASRCGII